MVLTAPTGSYFALFVGNGQLVSCVFSQAIAPWLLLQSRCVHLLPFSSTDPRLSNAVATIIPSLLVWQQTQQKTLFTPPPSRLPP